MKELLSKVFGMFTLSSKVNTECHDIILGNVFGNAADDFNPIEEQV